MQYALSDRTLAEPGRFVGLANVWNLWDNQIYRQTLWNTIVYTIGATILKLGAGLGLALLLNEQLPLKRLIRSAVLLPWIVPTVLSAMAWLWLLTPNFSVLNWILVHSGAEPARAALADQPRARDVLGDPGQHLARDPVLRDHAPGRAPDHPGGAVRGVGHRRRRDRGTASAT